MTNSKWYSEDKFIVNKLLSENKIRIKIRKISGILLKTKYSQ